MYDNRPIKAKAKYEANKDKGWNWDQWQDNEPEAVEHMEKHEPDLFRDLYLAQFGVLLKMGSVPSTAPSEIPKVMTLITSSLNVQPSIAEIKSQSFSNGLPGIHFAAGDPTPYNTEYEAKAAVKRMNDNMSNKKHVPRDTRNILDQSF